MCTLPIPCKHYKSVGEVGRETPHDQSLASVRTVGSGKGQSLDTSYEKYSEPQYFRVRYRSHRDISYSDSKRCVSLSTRCASRRLKILEKLDKYREEKYRREIERIEEMKRQEDAARQRSLDLDSRRNARNHLLKMVLAKHHEDRLQSQREQQEVSLRQLSYKKSVEKQRFRYLQQQVAFIQKEKLAEYRRKKQLIDGMQREQVGELGEE